MTGTFIPNAAADRDDLPWGFLRWFSRPASTQASHLVVLEVVIDPGFGHNFHRHPDQEEVLYVLDGQVEQWLEREKRILHPGDAIFIGKDVVHASFNASSRPAKFLAILGPCATDAGYVSVEVGDQAPWNGLR